MVRGDGSGLGHRLAAMTPTGRARVPLAWASYDFANTIFSFAVVSGAIGLWFTAPDRFGQAGGQLALSITIAASVGLNAFVSPILGALSDRTGRRLPFLLFFTILCIVPTALIGPSAALVGAGLFVVANFAYQAALIYYDATLRTVSVPAARGTLSGIGVAIGYSGTIFVGLLIFFLDLPVEARFPLVAVLFALFAVPIFVMVREPATGPGGGGGRVSAADVLRSWSQIRTTIENARAVPGLLRFIVGRFFYSDAVNTVIVVMSVVAVNAKGLTPGQTNLVLLSLTVVAIGASVGWGRLVDRIGPKRSLLVVLTSWAVGLTLGAISLSLDGALGIGLFLVAGAILGSGLGGVQVADRVLLVRLAPPERLGEVFGLYGLAGKASQVIGQLLYGAIVFLLLDAIGVGAYQLAIGSLLVTMLVGAWLLLGVDDGSPEPSR